MLVKTSELIGPALDWAVAKCEGYTPVCDPVFNGNIRYGWYDSPMGHAIKRYSADWTHGGPVFEREIDNHERRVGYFYAHRFKRHQGRVDINFHTIPGDKEAWAYGPTLLVAAMRCYVASKLGDAVDVPDELLKTGESYAV